MVAGGEYGGGVYGGDVVRASEQLSPPRPGRPGTAAGAICGRTMAARVAVRASGIAGRGWADRRNVATRPASVYTTGAPDDRAGPGLLFPLPPAPAREL